MVIQNSWRHFCLWKMWRAGGKKTCESSTKPSPWKLPTLLAEQNHPTHLGPECWNAPQLDSSCTFLTGKLRFYPSGGRLPLSAAPHHTWAKAPIVHVTRVNTESYGHENNVASEFCDPFWWKSFDSAAAVFQLVKGKSVKANALSINSISSWISHLMESKMALDLFAILTQWIWKGFHRACQA